MELQYGLENLAVIVSARGIAAVFLGKVTHLKYCCTNTTATPPTALFKKKNQKKSLSSEFDSLFPVEELAFCLLLVLDVEITIFFFVTYCPVHIFLGKEIMVYD